MIPDDDNTRVRLRATARGVMRRAPVAADDNPSPTFNATGPGRETGPSQHSTTSFCLDFAYLAKNIRYEPPSTTTAGIAHKMKIGISSSLALSCPAVVWEINASS